MPQKTRGELAKSIALNFLLIKVSRKNGERTKEEFSKVTIPDYSVLLEPKFWMTSDLFKINAKD